MEVLAIIPARSGSKSLKDKNIKIMNGLPLIAHSIRQALASTLVTRVIVSTDSEEYANIAKMHGAEVPFLRPKEYSSDSSLDIDVFEHALKWLKNQEGYEPEICVHLRPTHPIREVKDIDAMISMLINDTSIDSVRSITKAVQIPYKMWLFKESSLLMHPVVSCDIEEAYNSPRQVLPVAYMQNACIDAIRTKTILEMHSMTGKSIAGYKMNYDYDIDTEADFLKAEQAQLLGQFSQSGKKAKICCDIDGIIAAKTLGNDYTTATPIQKNIDIINRLYDAGHEIILFTARGYATGINWREITEKQLKKWGVKFEKLLFGKPDADFYIDDKLVPISFFENF